MFHLIFKKDWPLFLMYFWTSFERGFKMINACLMFYTHLKYFGAPWLLQQKYIYIWIYNLWINKHLLSTYNMERTGIVEFPRSHLILKTTLVWKPARQDHINRLFFKVKTKVQTWTHIFWYNCLSLFGLLWQNLIIWVAQKQQKFISHGSRGREVQDQSPLPTLPSFHWGLFHKGTNPIHESSTPAA